MGSAGLDEPVRPVRGEPARQLPQARDVEAHAPLGAEEHLAQGRPRPGVVVGQQPAGEVREDFRDDGVGGVGLL